MAAQQPVKYAVDALSGGAIVASIMQWAPPIAALFGMLWYMLQVWESKTVQKWVRLGRAKRRAARRAKLP